MKLIKIGFIFTFLAQGNFFQASDHNKKFLEMKSIERRFLQSLKNEDTHCLIKVLDDYESLKKQVCHRKRVDFSFLIDKQYHNGQTALHSVIRKNDISKLTTLLQFGADVNIRDNQEKTPLDYALNNPRGINRDMVNILVDAGAHVSNFVDQNVNNFTEELEAIHI